MKTVFKVLVGLAAVLLAYLTFMSVYTPVQFDKKQTEREKLIEKRLKKIANYEAAFENVYGRYATGPELVSFLENGKVFYVNAEGEYTDAMREKGLTEKQAAAQGLIKRDTTWINAKDSLVKDNTDITDLLNVPGVSGKTIAVDTAYIQQIVGVDTIAVPVFQASVKFEDYLGDLDKVRLQQKVTQAKSKAHGFPGLKIGSLTEVKNTGNWE
ncbi:hypothetical protein [Porphyromonas pogonae]|uniref:hypothetical protein n=1 Tax=Porphyromonas pogonae TaxID=867595 RepID=UPI002E7722DA|nr:hypothetical protein [Porphyromonas pogonae]